MLKRFLIFLVVVGASAPLGQARTGAPQPSLEEMTATMLGASGGDSERLLFVAAERAELLSKLVESDPAQVLRLAVSPEMRRSLPSPMRDFVEERVELEGTLQVLYEDYENWSRLLHYLETDSGGRYALHFASEVPRLRTGARVKVSGLRVGEAIAVESGARHVRRLSFAPIQDLSRH